MYLQTIATELKLGNMSTITNLVSMSNNLFYRLKDLKK